MRFDIVLQIIQLPVGERVHLIATIAVLLNNIHFLTRASLEAFASGNQRVKPFNGARLRQHFADVAAAIRVALP